MPQSGNKEMRNISRRSSESSRYAAPTTRPGDVKVNIGCMVLFLVVDQLIGVGRLLTWFREQCRVLRENSIGLQSPVGMKDFFFIIFRTNLAPVPHIFLTSLPRKAVQSYSTDVSYLNKLSSGRGQPEYTWHIFSEQENNSTSVTLHHRSYLIRVIFLSDPEWNSTGCVPVRRDDLNLLPRGYLKPCTGWGKPPTQPVWCTWPAKPATLAEAHNSFRRVLEVGCACCASLLVLCSIPTAWFIGSLQNTQMSMWFFFFF